MRCLRQGPSPSRNCRQKIWEVFEEERPQLVPLQRRFDGFHAVSASVSKTCLVRFDNNKYSVKANAVGRPVEIQAYADRIVIRQDGIIVGEHRRRIGREETAYDRHPGEGKALNQCRQTSGGIFPGLLAGNFFNLSGEVFPPGRESDKKFAFGRAQAFIVSIRDENRE
jgi:hypothetical protein